MVYVSGEANISEIMNSLDDLIDIYKRESVDNSEQQEIHDDIIKNLISSRERLEIAIKKAKKLIKVKINDNSYNFDF